MNRSNARRQELPPRLATRGIQALDFDPFPAGAMHHESDNLIALLHHLHMSAGGARDGVRQSLPRNITMQSVRRGGEAQRGSGKTPFTFEKRFQWGVVSVGAGVIGTGRSTSLLSLKRFLAVSVRLSVNRSVDSESGDSPSGGRVSA